MMCSRSCSRAFSLAARLCCNENVVAWSHETPAAVHTLQLLQQMHSSINTPHSTGSSVNSSCHSKQQHAQWLAPAVHHLWPAVWTLNKPGTYRKFGGSSNTEDGDTSSSGSGYTPTTAAAVRPRDLALVFTCGKCDTRAVKAFTRQAYEHGLVLITCPGCKSMHLIADHLGWFGDSGFKIDEYLASQGQQVKRINMAQLEHSSARITAEDMAGWSKVQQLLSTVAGAAADNTQSESSGGCCGGNGHAHDSTSNAKPSQQGTESTETAATASDMSSGSADSSETSETTDSSMGGDVNSSMLQEAHSGVVEVAPSDVEAWVRVQQQKQQGEGRT